MVKQTVFGFLIGLVVGIGGVVSAEMYTAQHAITYPAAYPIAYDKNGQPIYLGSRVQDVRHHGKSFEVTGASTSIYNSKQYHEVGLDDDLVVVGNPGGYNPPVPSGSIVWGDGPKENEG